MKGIIKNSKMYKELRFTIDDVNILNNAIMLLVKTSDATKKNKKTL